jgi:hypothetical protein
MTMRQAGYRIAVRQVVKTMDYRGWRKPGIGRCRQFAMEYFHYPQRTNTDRKAADTPSATVKTGDTALFGIIATIAGRFR